MKIKGIVIKGKQKGRTLGFLTANLALEGGLGVKSGVYAGQASLAGKMHDCAIFVSPDGGTLEAHIFDFSGDLYGQEIEVELGQKIREVQKFESAEELKKQIALDIEIIKSLPTTSAAAD